MNNAGLLAATWWGVGLAAAVGVGGLIVGIIGLAQAMRARALAAAANALAKEANEVSKQANALSEESNLIAGQANDISRGYAQRADELHDVAWEWSFDETHLGMVSVQNIGKNKAVEVTIQFVYESTTEAAELAVVEGRRTVSLEIPGLREDITFERQALNEAVRQSTRPNIVGSFSWNPGKKVVRLRVKWRTELGTPKTYDSKVLRAALPR